MKPKVVRLFKMFCVKRRYNFVLLLLGISVGPLFLISRFLVTNDNTHQNMQIGGKKPNKLNTMPMYEKEPKQTRERFGLRRQYVLEYCKKHLADYDRLIAPCRGRNPVEVNSYRLTSYELVTCVIPHSAEVILKQTLQMLVTSVHFKNPFLLIDLDISGYTLKRQQLNIIEMFKTGVSKRFTIVRDPYARLLSFYMDNLYMPNSWAWRTLAKSIRPGDSRNCIYNITFSEFVDYFIKMNARDSCSSELLYLNTQDSDPCNMQYNYIGKFENLEEDLNYILNEFDLLKHISIPHFKTDYDTLSITRYVANLFREVQDTMQDCGIDFTMAANRLWRLLQGKGILGRFEVLPFTEDKIPQSKMQTLTLSTYLNGQEYDRTNNAELFLSEAYFSISEAAVGKLQDIFKVDFEMYGYEPYPEYIRIGKQKNKLLRPKFLNLE